MCLVQKLQPSDMGEARTRGPWSRVKHYATALPSLIWVHTVIAADITDHFSHD